MFPLCEYRDKAKFDQMQSESNTNTVSGYETHEIVKSVLLYQV